MNCTGECACNDSAPAKSLYHAIDHSRVTAVNELKRGSCAAVVAKTHEQRHSPEAAQSRSASGLLVKIPFKFKVAITRVDFRGTFSRMDVYANNQYVALDSAAKPVDSFALPDASGAHIVPVALQPFKYKSVDLLTLRLAGADGAADARLLYLGLRGVVSGSLPAAVNVSYEVYPVPKSSKSESRAKFDVQVGN